MDPKKATNEKVIRARKPDHTLISFVGDDSYGWFPKGRDIIAFYQNYDSKSRQAASKRVDLKQACLQLLHTKACKIDSSLAFSRGHLVRMLAKWEQHLSVLCMSCHIYSHR